MPASWPTSVKSFTRVVNGVTKLVAALYNSAYDEIEAIQTNLSGSVVQVVNTMYSTAASGATALPVDNTIPQITEGNEYITLAITPKNAANKLRIDVVLNLGPTSSKSGGVALFQDATAGALAAQHFYSVSGSSCNCKFTYYMIAGTVSATTFRVRAGTNDGTTLYVNSDSGGSAVFNGVSASSITITEIKA